MEPKPLYQIRVKNLTGRIDKVSAFAGMKVGDFKKKYQRKFGILHDHQRMIFIGRHLEDERKLGDYGLQDGDCVHLVLRLRGGGPGPSCVTSSDMTACGRFTSRHTENSDRHTLFPGVNFRGICVECDGSSTARLGYREFTPVADLMAECVCPDCGTRLEQIHAIYFSRGHFEVRGRRRDDGDVVRESGYVRKLEVFRMGEDKLPERPDLTEWDYFALAVGRYWRPAVPEEWS